MRVLIAPDKFAGTLSAVEAAEAIAEGWRRRAPGDELDLAPMSDGGPGFVDVVHAALGGDLLAVTVEGPYGDPVPGLVLRVGDTAYVESAHACGLHLTRDGDPEKASTYGVGQLVAAAVDSGARRVVIGLGGSGTSDGGAGLLAALGAEPSAALRGGAAGLAGLDQVELPTSPDADLLIASDVDIPLTGLFGAAKTYGPRKGIAEERLPAVDGLLVHFAERTDSRLALEKGAGAAGGLGFGLMLLGASREPGIELVAGLVDLAARARSGRPRDHRGGCVRLLQPIRQGALRGRRRRGRGNSAVHRPRRSGAGRLTRDAGAGNRGGVLRRGPGGRGPGDVRSGPFAGSPVGAYGAQLVPMTKGRARP